jgi:shikimate kinase
MKNLVLVGFMGTGKTAVGQRVARHLGFSFVDTDQLIEQRTGQSIAQIFAARGEPYFRKLERELVKELASEQDRVIATGGGIILDQNNIRDLARTGVVICLWAEPDVIYERTKNATHRPLLNEPDPRQRITDLLRQRAPLYRAIPLRVDNSLTTVDQDVESVLALYRNQATGTHAGV